MIALISSTIFPSARRPGGHPVTVAPNDRLAQTRATIDSLVRVGFTQIYLADNSGSSWQGPDESYFAPARLLSFETPTFDNIGISEIHLLRRALREIPDGEPVMKISGRYLLGRHPDPELGGADVLARVYGNGRRRHISTRCYAVRSRSLLEELLQRTLEEIYAASARIVGPRSFARIIGGSIRPRRTSYRYDDPPLAVEFAAWTAIRQSGWSVHQVDQLFLEGQSSSVAGLYIRE